MLQIQFKGGNMKKIKLLTGLFALSLTLISAHADTFDSQTIQAVLPAYVDIQAQTGTLQDGIDAQSGKLNNGFQSIFRITTNDPIKLHLSAKTQTDSGASEAFFQKGSDHAAVHGPGLEIGMIYFFFLFFCVLVFWAGAFGLASPFSKTSSDFMMVGSLSLRYSI